MRAQATVEMAVVAPVLLVLALIAYNLMMFAAATARFDRAAPDVVLAHGVSPEGEEGATASADAAALVARHLEAAMEGHDVTIEVKVEQGAGTEEGGMLSMVGALRTYRCVMVYKPWPGNWSIAGVQLVSPLELRHVRDVTVDPWRSGVVM